MPLIPLGNEFLFGPEDGPSGTVPLVRMRLHSFQLPPIRDLAVVGRRAPISRDILAQTLRLLCPEPFVEIDVCDDRVAAILVRKAILLKISSETVMKRVLQKIKPVMSDTEIVAVHLEIEVALGEGF